MSIGKRALVLKRTHKGERTLGSLTLAVGALALGLIALDLFGRLLPAPTPTDGLLALVGAGLLFALAVLRAPRTPARVCRRRAGNEAAWRHRGRCAVGCGPARCCSWRARWPCSRWPGSARRRSLRLRWVLYLVRSCSLWGRPISSMRGVGQ